MLLCKRVRVRMRVCVCESGGEVVRMGYGRLREADGDAALSICVSVPVGSVCLCARTLHAVDGLHVHGSGGVKGCGLHGHCSRSSGQGRRHGVRHGVHGQWQRVRVCDRSVWL